MNDGDVNPGDLGQNESARYLTLALGLVFALQIVVPAWDFFRQTSFHTMIAGLPFVGILVAVALKNPAALTVFFPLSALPVLAVLPPDYSALLHEDGTPIRIAATLGIYLALASSWVASKGTDIVDDDAIPDEARALWMRRFVWSRLALMVLLFLVPTYALFGDSTIVATLNQTHAGYSEVGRIFISLMIFFGWCAMAYMAFIIPSLNLEYDRRRLRRDAETMRRGYDRRRWVRVGVECSLALVVAFGVILI